MSDTTTQSTTPMTSRVRPDPDRLPVYEQPKGLGWVVFAAVMLMISGGLQVAYGLVALFNDEWIVWTNVGALYFDLTTWGWVHLITGGVVVLSGLGLLSGNVVARLVGVVMATLSLIVNFMFIPAYPVWALTVIAVDIIIIWAIIARGGDVRTL